MAFIGVFPNSLYNINKGCADYERCTSMNAAEQVFEKAYTLYNASAEEKQKSTFFFMWTKLIERPSVLMVTTCTKHNISTASEFSHKAYSIDVHGKLADHRTQTTHESLNALIVAYCKTHTGITRLGELLLAPIVEDKAELGSAVGLTSTLSPLGNVRTVLGSSPTASLASVVPAKAENKDDHKVTVTKGAAVPVKGPCCVIL